MTTVRSGTRMNSTERRALNQAVDDVWELVDGILEPTPPPTFDHRNLVDFLVAMIDPFQMRLPTPFGWAASGMGLTLAGDRAPAPDMAHSRTERAHLIRGRFVEGIPDTAVYVARSVWRSGDTLSTPAMTGFTLPLGSLFNNPGRRVAGTR